MGCTDGCKLCDRIRISQSVTYTEPNLVVNLPAGSYDNRDKYCIVVAQDIPSTATVSAPVMFTIGEGTELYPMVQRDGTPLTAAGLHSMSKYPCVCITTATSAVFRLLRKVCCPTNSLTSVNGTSTATADTTEG